MVHYADTCITYELSDIYGGQNLSRLLGLLSLQTMCAGK